MNAPRVEPRPPLAWDSDPFGVASPNENPSGAGEFKFNLRFPGQYADAETGLNYNYFRDYNPKTGRYAQSDPIGLNGGLNTFSYAGSSPLNTVDPKGLAHCVYVISKHIFRCENSLGEAATILENIFSGKSGACLNNVLCAGIRASGPIPPGKYIMARSTKYQPTAWRLFHLVNDPLYLLNIGRGEFYLHLGTQSMGCITVNKNSKTATSEFELVDEVLSEDILNTLEVVN